MLEIFPVRYYKQNHTFRYWSKEAGSIERTKRQTEVWRINFFVLKLVVSCALYHSLFHSMVMTSIKSRSFQEHFLLQRTFSLGSFIRSSYPDLTMCMLFCDAIVSPPRTTNVTTIMRVIFPITKHMDSTRKKTIYYFVGTDFSNG